MASAGVRINFNNIPTLLRNNPIQADLAIDALARDGERYVKQSIENSPASGETYVVGSGQIHVASSPGNPPRVDTGTLLNSIHVRKAGQAKRLILAGTDYAFALEFGTSTMAPRPFMMPMLAYLRQHGDDFFDNLIKV